MNPIRRGLVATLGYLFSKAAGYNSVVTSGLTAMSPELLKYIGGSPSAAGKTVNETTAMCLSAAWCCMRIISESIGMLPWGMYRSDGRGNAAKADDHPLAAVLASPNIDMTGVEFREAKGLNLCQAGNAYSMVERMAGQVTSLYPIRSSLVQPKQKLGSNTKLQLSEGAVFFSVNDRGRYEDYPREKIWHVKGFGNDGIVGLSPLGAAREAMGLALATDEFGARFFSQGGRPSGIVSTPQWLSKENREIARENLTQMLGGLANAHKFALFEGGLKPEPWGNMPLQDMEFVLLRRLNVQEICRFYRIAPHMVADLEKGASYASIEQMSSEFVMFTLMPYLTRIEASVSKWLLTAADRSRYFLRFNYEGLLRADSKARSEFYSSAVQNAYMNRNEVRAKENLNRVDGLDTYTAQTNLAPVEMLGEIATAAARKPAPAQPVGGKGDTTVHANISLPEAIAHKVEHGAAPGVPELAAAVRNLADKTVTSLQKLAESITSAQGDLAVGVHDLAEAVEKTQRDAAALAESGNELLASQVLEGNKALARRLTDGQAELGSELGKGQKKIAEAVRGLANQKRKVIVGGETFVSEPAE